MLQAEEIRYIVMAYWRFTRRHYLVAPEYNYRDVDLISVSANGKVVCETEIKVSIGDLKKEKQKPKHIKDAFGNKLLRSQYVREFYFAMPAHMAEFDRVRLICDGRFPYAGILAVDPYEDYLSDPQGSYHPAPVRCIKDVKQLQPCELTEAELMSIARGMSNSFINLAFRLMRTERELT